MALLLAAVLQQAARLVDLLLQQHLLLLVLVLLLLLVLLSRLVRHHPPQAAQQHLHPPRLPLVLLLVQLLLVLGSSRCLGWLGLPPAVHRQQVALVLAQQRLPQVVPQVPLALAALARAAPGRYLRQPAARQRLAVWLLLLLLHRCLLQAACPRLQEGSLPAYRRRLACLVGRHQRQAQVVALHLARRLLQRPHSRLACLPQAAVALARLLQLPRLLPRVALPLVLLLLLRVLLLPRLPCRRRHLARRPLPQCLLLHSGPQLLLVALLRLERAVAPHHCRPLAAQEAAAALVVQLHQPPRHLHLARRPRQQQLALLSVRGRPASLQRLQARLAHLRVLSCRLPLAQPAALAAAAAAPHQARRLVVPPPTLVAVRCSLLALLAASSNSKAARGALSRPAARDAERGV